MTALEARESMNLRRAEEAEERADKLEAALRIADQALTATLNVVQLSEPTEAILTRYRVPLNEAHATVRAALAATSYEAKS